MDAQCTGSPLNGGAAGLLSGSGVGADRGAHGPPLEGQRPQDLRRRQLPVMDAVADQNAAHLRIELDGRTVGLHWPPKEPERLWDRIAAFYCCPWKKKEYIGINIRLGDLMKWCR